MSSAAPSLAWDYSALAASYDKRADYDAVLVHETLRACGAGAGDRTLEVGAGTGKLTRLLCEHGLDVIAVEPNHSMRSIALGKPALHRARWLAAVGEALPVRAASMRLVAYGSSFNVLETGRALDECARVLVAGGHCLALWNHRDLDDPLQAEVEACIHRHIPGYDYGSRRAGPDAAIERHPSFGGLRFAQARFLATIPAADWLDAWRSHATLARQAGSSLGRILLELEALVAGRASLDVPYFTRIWTAQKTT
jgi:ubiquinone/menaquinone biosynthesis C-methylase UbiE